MEAKQKVTDPFSSASPSACETFAQISATKKEAAYKRKHFREKNLLLWRLANTVNIISEKSKVVPSVNKNSRRNKSSTRTLSKTPVPSISPCRQRGGGRRRRPPEGGDGADKVAVGQRGLAVVGLQDPGGKNSGKCKWFPTKCFENVSNG